MERGFIMLDMELSNFGKGVANVSVRKLSKISTKIAVIKMYYSPECS